jgi:23S rRNA (uracil1939-C5)-methyltransferase
MSGSDDVPAGSVHCEHGERCGGCTLLDVPEVEQLARKQKAVSEALARYPSLRSLQIERVAAGRPSTAYRTRAKLMVSPTGAIGLYARGSHDVIDILQCRVLGAEVAATIDGVRQLVRRSRPRLTSLDVREARHAGATALLVTLGGSSAARRELELLAHEVAGLPGVAGVALSERDRRSPTFFGETPRLVVGAGSARDTLTADGPYYLASHGGFVQAHRAQAAAIGGCVSDGLAKALGTLRGARVLELYAGSGALGLLLCRQGAHCTLVERFAPALELAEQAARAQGIDGLHTRAGDAAQVVDELARDGERFDAVLVNPPRRGLPSALRAKLAALGPRLIAYVSCDPATLARDLAHLAQLGYAARSLTPFDMMPLTDSVEALVLLAPAPPPAISVLYEDDVLIAVDKPPHLSTTPGGGQQQSLLERVRAERGLPELAPIHRLDLGTSGVCLLGKRRDAIAGFAAALKAGQKHYLALARGITRDKGSIRRPLRDGSAQRDARTRYTRLEVLGGHSLLRVRPDEGRTHQIRRHLAAIGHPVLGDERYGDPPSNRHFEQKHGLDRAFLHLGRVELVHPSSGAALVLEAELPGDLVAVRERLRGGRDAAVRGLALE